MWRLFFFVCCVVRCSRLCVTGNTGSLFCLLVEFLDVNLCFPDGFGGCAPSLPGSQVFSDDSITCAAAAAVVLPRILFLVLCAEILGGGFPKTSLPPHCVCRLLWEAHYQHGFL